MEVSFILFLKDIENWILLSETGMKEVIGDDRGDKRPGGERRI